MWRPLTREVTTTARRTRPGAAATPPVPHTALVTGASSGIGAAVAASLVERGYRVVGTSRDPAAVTDPVTGVEYVALDLADPAAVGRVAAEVGRVDVLVNNAGESQSGPLEELPPAAVRRLFEVNVFGAVRLTQLLLPGMRERGYGRVIMIGSMLASFPLAYRSSYVASKAAIKGFANAARREVAPYGVGISTVEPGSINTGIGGRRTQYIGADSPFTAEYRTMLAALDANEAAGAPASAVAAVVIRAVEAHHPRSLYAVGSNAPLVFTLRRLLPRAAVERAVARRHGLR
ncbi:SDR family oxidoreductase [Parafrankia sp. FMc2]|uniref:SDR family oxidoreductase n=1 Tax=Parafrankia sp. FMc2 TaxID=3233196 RepID=UPI0034D5353F